MCFLFLAFSNKPGNTLFIAQSEQQHVHGKFPPFHRFALPIFIKYFTSATGLMQQLTEMLWVFVHGTCILLNNVQMALSSSSTLVLTSPIMALSRIIASRAEVWSSFTAWGEWNDFNRSPQLHTIQTQMKVHITAEKRMGEKLTKTAWSSFLQPCKYAVSISMQCALFSLWNKTNPHYLEIIWVIC